LLEPEPAQEPKQVVSAPQLCGKTWFFFEVALLIISRLITYKYQNIGQTRDQ
jgi:hypothetical protein